MGLTPNISTAPPREATPSQQAIDTCKTGIDDCVCCGREHGLELYRLYVAKCEELQVKPNSGIERLLLDEACCCKREHISLRNLLLGTRGILALPTLVPQ